jgi:glycosyltransferase involved in cell wall biosynthesis
VALPGVVMPLTTLKIFHLITDLDTGGAEMMLYKLLVGINRQRFSHVVVSLTDAGVLSKRIEALGIPVHTLSMHRGRPNLAGLWRLLQLLMCERPDVLQTWLYHANLLGLIAGKLMRVPAIARNIRCSNMDMRYYSRLSALIVRILAWVSPLPDVVLINTETGREFHEALHYRPRRRQVIPNGFDVSLFRPDPAARFYCRRLLGLPLNPILIGLIARYDPMKDHYTFLQAASYLLKDRSDIHFVLIGRNVTESNNDLTMIIQDLGISDHIHLLGERWDVPKIMQALDIMALTSAFGEGFPNVIGEAMASGVPCVVTDVRDAPLIVGDTGRVVPAQNPHATAHAWGELIDLPSEESRRLGLAARQRIAQHFSLRAVVTQYTALYEELSAGGQMRGKGRPYAVSVPS